MKKITILLYAIALAACSSRPANTVPTQADILPEQVISRIDQMSARFT